MSILVVAEHENSEIKAVTLNTIAAGVAIGGDIHVLVAGQDCAAAGEAASKIMGVAKVLVADSAEYANGIAENLTPLVLSLSDDYEHMLANSTSFGKNLMPRVAAMLDVQQISEISGVTSADTFDRPTYAGNAIATVQTSDAKKVITVRGTAFDPVAAEGVDHQPLLVRCDDFERRRIEVDDTFLQIDDIVDQGQLHVEPRFHLCTDHVAEAEHQRLLGLVDGEQRTGRRDDQKDDNDNRHKTCGTHVSFLPTTCSTREVADTAQHRYHRQARQ